MRFLFFTVFFLCYCSGRCAGYARWNTRSAEVWLPVQTVSGTIDSAAQTQIRVHCNDTAFIYHTDRYGNFSVELLLKERVNKIWIEFYRKTKSLASDTLVLTLGYQPVPVVLPFATISEREVNLSARIIENPYNKTLSYFWKQTDTLERCDIRNAHERNASLTIPEQNGIYQFSLRVVADGDTGWFKTLVIKNGKGVHAFNIDEEHARWIDDAIIYQITPFAFVKNGTFRNLTAKLAEIQKLGINTILLQPVFKTFNGGQGYDITDYFSLRPDTGDETDFLNFIKSAHQLNLKVMLDMVPNHTSIHHPYATDYTVYQERSHYYDFYQHEKDDNPYARHYHQDSSGFIYYFWEDLVNLDYNNPEVQQWMIQACLYWLKKFDIDGYRFDAVWGVNARNPGFGKRLRTILKSVKPEFFMLAEDKAAHDVVYTLGFDAAYDWTGDFAWVSQWSWQTTYNPGKNPTVFNDTNLQKNKKQLERSILDKKHGLVVRFMENNDLPRFIVTHGVERTKMAAALLFALPGIPLLYNGQETGRENHPYSSANIYSADSTILSYDNKNLFTYYQTLIRLRKQHNVLKSEHMQQIDAGPAAGVIAIYKTSGREECLVIINIDSIATDAIFENRFSHSAVNFTDLLSKDNFQGDSKKVMHITMRRYSVRWLFRQN